MPRSRLPHAWPLLLALPLLLAPAGAHAEDEYDQFRYLYVDTARPMFRRETLPDGNCVLKTNRPVAQRPTQFPCRKKPGTRRVFVIGGSVAADIEPDRSRLPSTVEWINCAMGQYDSARDLAILREILAYEPDLVILTTGNNEGLPAAGRLDRLRWRVRRALKTVGLSGPRPAYSITALFDSFDEEALTRALETRLDEMLALVNGSGAKALVCTLPVNYEDLPPWGVTPWTDRDFVEGTLRLELGDAPGADAAFARALLRLPGNPFVLFWRGRADAARGRDERARENYLAAVQANGLGRVTPSRNDALRRSAARAGVEVADLFAVVERLGGGLIGFSVVRDNVHWLPAIGSRVVAAVLSTKTARAVVGGVAPPQSPDAISARASAREFLSRGAVQWIEAERWFPKPPMADRTVAYDEHALKLDLSLLQDAEGSLAKIPEFFSMNVFAAGLTRAAASAEPKLLAHLAEAARRRGKVVEALALFDRALEVDPGFAPSYLGRAAARWRQGRGPEAERDLVRAQELGLRDEAAAWREAFARVPRR